MVARFVIPTPKSGMLVVLLATLAVGIVVAEELVAPSPTNSEPIISNVNETKPVLELESKYFKYPAVRRDESVKDDYFGTVVNYEKITYLFENCNAIYGLLIFELFSE